MTNKRKVNTLQPQISLQKTKEYKAPKVGGSSPNNKRDYERPDRFGFNRDVAMINQAAAHPRETIGYNLGKMLGNYFDRQNDKIQMKRRNEMGAALEDALAARYQAEENPFRVLQVPVDVPQAEEQANNSETMQNAQQAAETARAAGQEALATGQVPTTAAGVNALGMNAKDERQFAVQRSKAQEYADWGPNPKQAQREQENITKTAASYQNANLAGVTDNELFQLIDQMGGANSKHISSRRSQANIDYWKNYYSKKRDDDTLNMAIQSSNNYRYATDEQKKKMRPQLLELEHQLRNKGFTNAAAIVNKPFEEEYLRNQAIADMMLKNQMEIDKHEAFKDIDLKYHKNAKAYDSMFSSSSSGSGGSNGKKAEKEEDPLEQLIKKRDRIRKSMNSGAYNLKNKDDVAKLTEMANEIKVLNDRINNYEKYEKIEDENYFFEPDGEMNLSKLREQAQTFRQNGATVEQIYDYYVPLIGQDFAKELVDRLFNPEYF